MKIIVQKTPDPHAFLLDENDKLVESEVGSSELEAVGRLVTLHSDRFGLTGVSGKRGEPINTED